MPDELIIPSESEILDSIEDQSKERNDRDVLTTAVKKDLKWIVQAMVQCSKGMWIEKTVVNKDGVEVSVPVYQEVPNMAIAQYLVNQVLGRATEAPEDLTMKQNVIVQNEIIIKKYVESPAGDK